MKKVFLLSLFVLFECVYAQNEGLPDEDFGGDGFVLIDRDDKDYMSDFVVLENNDIISVGGSDLVGFYRESSVLKLLDSGEVDESFGDNGWVDFNSVNVACKFTTVFLTDDNKILCGGNAGDEGLLVKYNMDGTLDSSFGDNGFRVYPNFTEVFDIRSFQNGDLLILDKGYNGLIYKKLIVNGDIVEDFGNNGVIANSIINLSKKEILLDNEGNIYDVGFDYDYFKINKYNSSGEVDGDFAVNGELYKNEDNSNGMISVIVDDKINVLTGSYSGIKMHQYLLDGAIDPNFNDFEVIEFSIFGWGAFNEVFRHFRQENGRFLIAFDVMSEYNSDIAIFEINADYEIDLNFGGYFSDYFTYGDINEGVTYIPHISNLDGTNGGTFYLNMNVKLDNQNRILLGSNYHTTNYDPLCILNNADFNIVNISIKDKLIDVLYSC